MLEFFLSFYVSPSCWLLHVQLRADEVGSVCEVNGRRKKCNCNHGRRLRMPSCVCALLVAIAAVTAPLYFYSPLPHCTLADDRSWPDHRVSLILLHDPRFDDTTHGDVVKGLQSAYNLLWSTTVPLPRLSLTCFNHSDPSVLLASVKACATPLGLIVSSKSGDGPIVTSRASSPALFILTSFCLLWQDQGTANCIFPHDALWFGNLQV